MLAWFKKKPTTERGLSHSEAQAYQIGFDDGAKHVLDQLATEEPDRLSNEARDIIKRLIITNALESVDTRNPKGCRLSGKPARRRHSF